MQTIFDFDMEQDMRHSMPSGVRFKSILRKLRGTLRPEDVDFEVLCIGIVEKLYHLTITEAPEGDIGKFDDDEIASACGINSDARAFIDALVATGFLQTCKRKRLVVANWAEEAPNFLKARFSRDEREFCVAQPDPSACKLEYKKVGRKVGSAERPLRGVSEASQTNANQTGYPEEFSRAWNAWPKRNGRRHRKRKSFERWQKLSGADRESFQSAVDKYRDYCESTGEIAADMATKLNDQSWRDYLEGPDDTAELLVMPRIPMGGPADV